MILEIIKYGNPILRKKSEEVQELNDDIKTLIENMKETLLSSGNGIGLAAPQVGINKRLFVYSDLDEDKEPKDRLHAIINPIIKKKTGKDTAIEGCLSIPGMHAEVERAYRVVVEGMNEEGDTVRIKAEELLARCLQHEYDHLEGVMYIDIAEPDTLEPDEEKKNK